MSNVAPPSIRFNLSKSGEGTSSRSRGRNARGMHRHEALEKGGRREHRVFVAPAALRAMKKARKQVTTGTPKQSGAPCTMVYGLFRALPGVPGLIASVARRNYFRQT